MKVIPPRQPVAFGAPSTPTIRTYATTSTTVSRPIPPSFQKLIDDYNANPTDAKKRLLLAISRQLGITLSFSEQTPSPILSPFQKMVLSKQPQQAQISVPPYITELGISSQFQSIISQAQSGRITQDEANRQINTLFKNSLNKLDSADRYSFISKYKDDLVINTKEYDALLVANAKGKAFVDDFLSHEYRSVMETALGSALGLGFNEYSVLNQWKTAYWNAKRSGDDSYATYIKNRMISIASELKSRQEGFNLATYIVSLPTVQYGVAYGLTKGISKLPTTIQAGIGTGFALQMIRSPPTTIQEAVPSLAGSMGAGVRTFKPPTVGTPTIGQRLYTRLTEERYPRPAFATSNIPDTILRLPAPSKTFYTPPRLVSIITKLRETKPISKYIERSQSLPGREIEITSQKFLGDKATGISTTTPLPSSSFQLRTTTFGKLSTFIGRGKRIRIKPSELSKTKPYFKTEEVTKPTTSPPSITKIKDIEFKEIFRSPTGKYTVRKGYASQEFRVEPQPSPKEYTPSNALPEYNPAKYKEASTQQPRGFTAYQDISQRLGKLDFVPSQKEWMSYKFLGEEYFGKVPSPISATKYKSEMGALLTMGQRPPRIKPPGTVTRFSYVRPITDIFTETRPLKTTSTTNLYSKSQLIGELSKTKVVDLPSPSYSFVPLSFSTTKQTPATEQLRFTIPIVSFKTSQKQLQAQATRLETTQTTKTITQPITIQKTLTTKQPRTIQYKPTIPIQQPPSPSKPSQTGASYNVYIKKDATKRTRRWQKVNTSPLDFSSAAGLGVIRAKNTASRTFRLQPTTGKPTHNESYSQAWSSYRYQFYEKVNAPLTYIQRTTYSISTVGEKQEITFAPRYKPRTYKPKKMIV